MDTTQYLERFGNLPATDHLQDLPGWLDAMIQATAPDATISDLYEVVNSTNELEASNCRVFPAWIAEGALYRSVASLITDAQSEIAYAIEQAASNCTIEITVDVSVYVNGELIEDDSYHGEDIEDAESIVREAYELATN
jgi:hypothetical protein